MNDSILVIQKYARLYICKKLKGKIAYNFECPICIDSCKTGLKLTCNHQFHFRCILKWVNREESCPLCRRHTFNSTIHKLKTIHMKLIEIFKIPLETLLGFKSAIDISLYDKDEYIYQNLEKYVFIIHQNFECLNDNTCINIYNKYKILKKIKKDIIIFDEDKKRMTNVVPENDKILTIKKRLYLKCEYLLNRSKDFKIEQSKLSSDKMSRYLHYRICALSEIEKNIENYNNLHVTLHRHSPSRSLIPFAFSNFRNNAAVLTMSANGLNMNDFT